MTYRESLDWLYGLQVHGIKLGLETMADLCTALGIELGASPDRKIIHVAGTNGKGSVCAMAAAIASASGHRTGLYTSPHLVSFRERIRLGPHMIPEAHAAEGLTRIREAIEGWESTPTFFEVVTALALDWFSRQQAEWIILETGLGGRLDATNIVTPSVSVITSIGLDHTKYLGGTLEAIAGEKAGIIKPTVPVLTCPQPIEVEVVLRAAADRVSAPLTVIQNPVSENWELSLPGSHQRWNAALAFAAVITAGLRPDPRDVASALRSVEWPGRFQSVLDGRAILDGAHNPPAAQRLALTWRERFGDEPCTLVVGVLADKDVRGVLAALVPLARRVFCVTVQNPRAMPAADLARLVAELAPPQPSDDENEAQADQAPEGRQECTSHKASTPRVTCEAIPDFAPAVQAALAHSERVLVAGSLFLVGEALAHFGLAEGTQEVSAQ